MSFPINPVAFSAGFTYVQIATIHPIPFIFPTIVAIFTAE